METRPTQRRLLPIRVIGPFGSRRLVSELRIVELDDVRAPLGRFAGAQPVPEDIERDLLQERPNRFVLAAEQIDVLIETLECILRQIVPFVIGHAARSVIAPEARVMPPINRFETLVPGHCSRILWESCNAPRPLRSPYSVWRSPAERKTPDA